MDQKKYDQFLVHNNKAQQKSQQCLYKESNINYKIAKDAVTYLCHQVPQNQLSMYPYNLIVTLLNIARNLKHLKSFPEALAYTKEAANTITKYSSKGNISNFQKQQLMHRVFSDRGDIWLQHAESLPSQNFEETYEYTIKSLNQYKQSRDIVLKGLLKSPEKWQQSYLAITLNMINSLFVEPRKLEIFHNQTVFRIMLQIFDKIMRFYQSSKDKEKLKKSLSKFYYYRALSAIQLGRAQEGLKYYHKDYQFCKKKDNMIQEFRKTQERLFTYHFENQEFNESLKYLEQDKEKLALFKKKVQDYNQLKQDSDNFRSQQFIMINEQQQLERLNSYFENLFEEKWVKSALDFIEKNIHKFKDKPSLYYLLNFYAAEALFQKKQFKKGETYNKIAIATAKKDSNQYLDALIQNIHFLINKQNSEQEVKFRYEECLNVNKKLSLSQDFQNRRPFIEELMTVSKFIAKRKYFYEEFKRSQIYTDLQKQIMARRTSSHGYFHQAIENLDDQNSNSNGFRVSFYTNNATLWTNFRPNIESLQQKYRRLCSQKNVPIRTNMLQKIKQSKENLPLIQLSQYFLLFQDELRIFFKLGKIRCWDFKNFIVKDSFIDFLSNQEINYEQIQQFKLANRVQNFNNVLCLLNKLVSVQTLHFEKIPLMKIILNLDNFQFGMYNPNTLKVLKIKYCHLTDEFFKAIKNFSMLQKLNLSHNNLTGYGLNTIEGMESIQSLNLSYNPLSEQFRYHRCKPLRKFKIKGMKNHDECPDQIAKLLLITQIIDISENGSEFLAFILQKMQNLCTLNSIFKLQTIRKIYIRRSNIDQNTLKQLNMISILSNKLQYLDLRFCYFSQVNLKSFNIRRPDKYTIINDESQFMSPHIFM